jgi:hypothetical protein
MGGAYDELFSAYERLINAYEDEHRRAMQLQERVTHLETEVERLRALMIEMWDNAEDWCGPRASSHYRSEIATRIRGAGDG